MSRHVRVAVPVPMLGPLVYRLKDGQQAVRGARVIVPLGARRVTGLVLSVSAGAEASSPTRLRDVEDVLDADPFLPEPVVSLAEWVAGYYVCGVGEAVVTAAPPFAWTSSKARVHPREGGPPPTDALGRVVLDVLRADGAMTPAALRSKVARRARGSAGPAIDGTVRALLRAGTLGLEHAMSGPSARVKTIRRLRVTPAGLDPAVDEALTPRQREVLGWLRDAPDGLAQADVAARGVSLPVLARLRERGLVHADEVVVERDPFTADLAEAEREAAKAQVVFTDEQRTAFSTLAGLADLARFHVAVLHGVTGSGKTEVYRRLARHVAGAGRRVLILVPEIALTPAVAATFRHTFGTRVAILHSALSSGERHDEWHRIRRGEVDVVVGTRSAVFAPLNEVGLLIVDEEHDTSYKQEEAPRYHGRDVAIVRAQQAGALVVLGSATPAMETYRHARTGKYTLVEMRRRVGDRPLADVRVVDMIGQFAERGPDVVLSGPLLEALDARLRAGEQAIVLLNRRGYAASIICRACGDTFECPECSVSLTLHRRAHRLRCHYCGHDEEAPLRCRKCGEEYLEYVGIGTERVEAEIAAAFPSARLARVDRDTIRRRGEITRVLRRFAVRELDVLVGTQMLAKGHDFPAVTLVGVISADVGLGVADFRAAERTFQLLTQVAGRAGRGEIRGEAIIQTLFPRHYSIRHARVQDYAAFYGEELKYRESMRYPPTVGMASVVVRGATLGDALAGAADFVRAMRPVPPGVQVLGPATAPLGRLRGEHRAQVFLKSASRRAMREALERAVAARPELLRRLSIDVDPLNVL